MKCRACGNELAKPDDFWGLCWGYAGALSYTNGRRGCLGRCWIWFKKQNRVDDLHSHFDVAVDEWLEATK